MKLRKEASLVFMSTALLTVLAACAAAPEVTLESSVSPESPSQIEAEQMPEESAAPAEQTVSKLSELDLADVQAFLPEEDWEAFTEYLPVLRDGMPFCWTQTVAEWDEKYNLEIIQKDQNVTLSDFHTLLWKDDTPPSDELILDSLAVLDLDKNGTKELILCFYDQFGQYLILHREGEVFYGIDKVNRGFGQLQKNGVYISSGGAANNWWYTVSFQNGRFEERELGHQNGHAGPDNNTMEYVIDDEVVTETEFNAWVDEFRVGDVDWYYPNE